LFSVGELLLELGFTRNIFSEPEAGGVGGSARFGGGEGSGGVSSLRLLLFGVEGLDMLAILERRFKAARDNDADRGRGAYLVPSPRRINRAGFTGVLTFGTGTSSATSITGERHILAQFGLSLEDIGETGV
jgi:hypothetical protein